MVDKYDPEELVEQNKQEQREFTELATEVVQWFIEQRGDMMPREQTVSAIADEFDVGRNTADKAIAEVVGDIVDPVQQITVDQEHFIGVVDYKEFDNAGAYGYIHHDDNLGQQKRMVCARCVETEKMDQNVAHATEGQGSVSMDSDWDDLTERLTYHYTQQHSMEPEEIVPGASLVSGTTISGNNSIHTGNESDLSFFGDGIGMPIYATTSDVPASIVEGEVVYIDADSSLYVEDGV